MKRVLFICTANICRSPMAEAVFNTMARDKGSSSRAESAGVAALPGSPVGTNARATLEEMGIPVGEHRARQVSGEMLREADLVLVMSPAHAEALRRSFGNQDGKVHVLPEYAGGAVSGEGGVPDPHGFTMSAHRACLRQLLACIEPVMDRLAREVS